ncbi:DUF4010 domain-containing protein [Acidocella sp.]|uniref:MgtC/SapB family protein n=1 Tax=Acidocella sp. TaxID=50710 RepID=UPI0026196BBC|nr:DUF4010 domain-containing protein [Acidocella sp.]
MSTLLPAPLAAFLGTIGLAFIIGLELHAYRRRGSANLAPEALGFGTTRTVTLLAALGFVLWIIAPILPFAIGLGGLSLFLLLDYRKRMKSGDSSLLPSIIGILAFTLGPVVLTAPLAVLAALVILILLSLGEQAQIRRFSDAFPAEEGVTFAKFFILAGLIFPLLPDTAIPFVAGITWVKVWEAVLIISGISYLAYLTHRYVFPSAGTLLTGVLGGLYSSTAATVVLSRTMRAGPAGYTPAAIVLATAMMYARLLVVIVLLGHAGAAAVLAVPFGGLCAACLGVALLLSWHARPRNPAGATRPPGQPDDHPAIAANPLDLPVAFLFALLFVFFAAVTNLVTQHYGAGGLHILSFAVGFSDIDPFIFSLLDGKFQLSLAAITNAVLIASASNNLLKAAYALALSRRRAMLPAAGWLLATAGFSLVYALG